MISFWLVVAAILVMLFIALVTRKGPKYGKIYIDKGRVKCGNCGRYMRLDNSFYTLQGKVFHDYRCNCGKNVTLPEEALKDDKE